MACELTKGRSLDCKSQAGGISAVYFVQKDDVILTNPESGNITDIEFAGGASTTLYKYVLPRGTGSFTETITGSSENGTFFYEPSVTIMLHGLSAADQNEIKLLAQNRLVVFVQLNQRLSTGGHDVILCLGSENGLELTTGTAASGAAFGDMNGYNLTLSGMERFPVSILADYTSSPFDNTAFNSGSAITIDDN
tara:strand:+ start:471 stop:1052 length:582 start_codon:yes stop_codon:yes gene_type:complete